MKKIFLILILLTFSTAAYADECRGKYVQQSSFVYFDGKKGNTISGMDIEDHANKIILIFNHGGWGAKKK